MPAQSGTHCFIDRPVIGAEVETRDVSLFAKYEYSESVVHEGKDSIKVETIRHKVEFKTELRVPRTGVMFIGIGGNNGTTFAATLIANRRNLHWSTKHGSCTANWYGSIAKYGTVKIGRHIETSEDVFAPIHKLLPMLESDYLVLGGWDISSMRMDKAMNRAEVLGLDIQKQVADEMSKIEIFRGAYDPEFIATNQSVRADWIIPSVNKAEQLQQLRKNIRNFREKNKLENILVLWNGNTERFSEHKPGIHDTAQNLLNAIQNNEREIAPSLLYCVAAIQEGCAYINGSPQNTFCDGVLELAKHNQVYLAGDDLKTGQTKFKSAMADLLVTSALKPTSIVSYNHLGNNDGMNLSSEPQFKSKEITKVSVVDDMIASNRLLYEENEHPDHLIVIKYVPAVGDSKRALDEYEADICMNGKQTIVVHNTCEDSLLAVPIILDLCIFMELLQRITVRLDKDSDFHRLDTLNSILSLFLKAPQVPSHASVVNAFFPQREALVNFIKAAAGIASTDYVNLFGRLSPK